LADQHDEQNRRESPQSQDRQNRDEPRPATMSRRKFLANTGFVIGGVVVGGALGALIKGNTLTETPPPAGTDAPNFNRALMYFNRKQFAIVEAATERIFPADENGPGAKELGVAYFIDHQLAGDYGLNARDYMSPPFFTGEKTQGYQGRLRRREIYDIALREIENYSQSKYNTSFISLTPEQQDEVLSACENDEIRLTTINASAFFRMLRSNTLEGVYSDPLYGGNFNMNGWRMRNYPGNQMMYTDIIEKDFTQIEPVSLQQHMAQ